MAIYQGKNYFIKQIGIIFANLLNVNQFENYIKNVDKLNKYTEAKCENTQYNMLFVTLRDNNKICRNTNKKVIDHHLEKRGLHCFLDIS